MKKSIFKSKTIWFNLIIMILGAINQPFLASLGLTAQVQVLLLGGINMALRYLSKSEVIIP